MQFNDKRHVEGYASLKKSLDILYGVFRKHKETAKVVRMPRLLLMVSAEVVCVTYEAPFLTDVRFIGSITIPAKVVENVISFSKEQRRYVCRKPYV